MGYETLINFRRKIDGTLVGFKKCKYNLVAAEYANFNDLAKLTNDKNFRQHNTAVIALLEHAQSGQHMLVASCHLHWNPKLEYVKMGQAFYLLYLISKFAVRLLGEKEAPECPLIIGGDFNSLPDSNVLSLILDQLPHSTSRDPKTE